MCPEEEVRRLELPCLWAAKTAAPPHRAALSHPLAWSEGVPTQRRSPLGSVQEVDTQKTTPHWTMILRIRDGGAHSQPPPLPAPTPRGGRGLCGGGRVLARSLLGSCPR